MDIFKRTFDFYIGSRDFGIENERVGLDIGKVK